MQQPYTPPQLGMGAFHCPACNAFSSQKWYPVNLMFPGIVEVKDTKICICGHCSAQSIWKQGRMVFPDSSPAPLPNIDLPKEIINDFEEARNIISRSPRGACALLRLCVQKLCKHLGESGANLNDDIASLVKKGLNPKVQMSLDIVRVIGNEAVHPGQIDLRDKTDTAAQLCGLINVIADMMITHPKAIEALYAQLPNGKRNQIAERDSR